jgi:thiol-disulfide isomerase/thioredoxin
MTDEAPAAQPAPSNGAGAGGGPELRKPRKIFLLVGVVVAAALGVGLFTSVGSGGSPGSSGGSSGGSGGQPQAGDLVPAFSAANIGPVGPPRVSVPVDAGGNGRPAVILFFGNWCASCHQELPPLAAAVHEQDAAGGALSKIHVIGVDSEDSVAEGQSFIKSAGVTFPVATDPNVEITSGIFDFHGDPYTVFVKGNGKISKVVAGSGLTPSSFTADERALIPTGT